MEQTRNGAVARDVAAAGPLYPMALGRNPKGRAAYPMRAVRNNHAFAFMEPAEPLQRVHRRLQRSSGTDRSGSGAPAQGRRHGPIKDCQDALHWSRVSLPSIGGLSEMRLIKL